MNTPTSIEPMLKGINPFLHNRIIRDFVKPSRKRIDDCLVRANAYLADNSGSDTPTVFTYELLLRLFEWESRIAKSTSDLARRARPHIRDDGALILDIGANLGQFTRNLIENRRVPAILFEPVPVYRDYCRLVTAHLPGVRVVGKALSDATGTASFYVDHTNLGWNTLVGEKQTEGMTAIQVETVTLDDYFDEIGMNPKVSVMKIDVEGAEFRVLGGAHRTFSAMEQKPVIFLEIGWGTGHPDRDKEVAEFDWLIANGYQRFNYAFSATTDVVIMPETAVGG